LGGLFFFLLLFLPLTYVFWSVPIRINLKLCILETFGRTPWRGEISYRKPLPAQDSKNTKKKADMDPYLEWDSNPLSPLFELAKTFCAVDSVATVMGCLYCVSPEFCF
jgi:hypothetical protein